MHTPASALESRFDGGWAAYIDALEAKAQSANVAVIGVTDYCSIEGYKELRAAQEGGRLRGVLLIPNVEFRVSVQTRNGSAINIHILFSGSAADHVTQIERVLANIRFHYRGSPYNCTRPQLILLGRASDPTQTDDNGAYQVGVNIFKPEFKDFKNWWEGEIWLRENALIAVSNGGSDGASGLSQDGGFRAVREEFYRFSQIIFSPKPTCRKYFLGQGADSPALVKQNCGKLMPCIHGSDAHSLETLFEPDQQRYCWIKADPTFEGLRQILYEPEERVHIGATAPESFDENKVIDEVQFEAASDWFGTAKLELNSRLVTIIGEKGSGKTALADVIAHACGAWQETPASFLKKARGLLSGATANVRWRSGTISSAPLDAASGVQTPQVRYLS